MSIRNPTQGEFMDIRIGDTDFRFQYDGGCWWILYPDGGRRATVTPEYMENDLSPIQKEFQRLQDENLSLRSENELLKRNPPISVAHTNPHPPEKKARRIERLPPSTHFTVQQALDYVQQTITAGNLKDVLIVGWRTDDEYYCISSHMSREWSLWLLNEAIDCTRCVNRWAPSAEASR